MSISVVLTEEYKQQIFEELLDLNRKAVQQVKEEQMPFKRYLNQNELMKFFNTHIREIEKWRMHGLRRVRKGGSWLYDIQEVYEILEKLKEV